MKYTIHEVTAIKVVEWMARDSDVMQAFFMNTGATVEDIRADLESGEMLAAIMDHLLSQDNWIISCAEALNIAPEELVSFRQRLPGGGLPNWT